MAHRQPTHPKHPCPVCGREVAVVRSVERLWPHQHEGRRCRGTGARVDLYGTEVSR